LDVAEREKQSVSLLQGRLQRSICRTAHLPSSDLKKTLFR
jgi:hypothetical protein